MLEFYYIERGLLQITWLYKGPHRPHANKRRGSSRISFERIPPLGNYWILLSFDVKNYADRGDATPFDYFIEVTWLTIMGSLTEFNYNNWISVDWNSLSPAQFAQLFPNVHRYTC